MITINDKKNLSDQVIEYIVKNPEKRDLKPIDFYNQFIYDQKIHLGNSELADWLLIQIADMLLTNMNLLKEAI